MPATVFRYELVGDRHELYVGELSTAEGLSLLDGCAAVRIVRFGASGYQQHEWATEKELPALTSVHELRAFLEDQGSEMDLIDFAVDVDRIGALSTHDDGECHFAFSTRAALMVVLTKVAPQSHGDLLIDALLESPGMYITASDAGALRKFASFDAYLADR